METRAIMIERYGRPGVLVERQVPLPAPGVNEVHLEVEAAGVNFADLLMRAGLYATVPQRPFSPGFEIAGRVVSTGAGVQRWRVGDRVVALMRYGGYASDVVVRADQLVRYPESLRPEQAAAIPVVFLTAWLCLFESGRAREGESVLVLNAGGGVGTAAVQLAVLQGLRAIGTAGTPEKRAFVTDKMGAEACFDSRGEWESEVREHAGSREIDLALDPVGGRATGACRRLLAPLGRIVFYGLSEAFPGDRRSWLAAARAWYRTPRFHPLSLIEPNIGVLGVHLLHLGKKEILLRRTLEKVMGLVEKGDLSPVIDRVFSLDKTGAAAAHAHIHARRNLGKVVLTAER